MLLTNSNRALLQGMMAGALVLASATACSRSDRSESGSDNSAALSQDTAGTISDTDTAAVTGATTETGAATADTAPIGIPRDAPRAATAPPSAELQDTSLQGDSAAAGYRAMERDTAMVPESDSAPVTEDTSGISADTSVSSIDTADTSSVEAAVSDTSVTEMARDTSTTADQIDTTGAAVSGEVALETTADTGWTETAADTTGAAVSGDVALEARVDTAQADAGVSADADVSADTDLAVGTADTTGNAGRIRQAEDSTEIMGEEADRVRPPEDSTELHGGVISDETADEQIVNAEDEVAATSESRTDEVGAAAVVADVTGTEAVALVTRQGARCIVLDPEVDEKVRWDMSNTPVGLNPCGLGSMNLSKLWTER